MKRKVSSVQKIQLAILLSSLDVPAWQEHLIHLLNQSGYANVAAFVILPNQDKAPHSVRGSLANPQYWIYNLYTCIDRMLFQPQPSAFEPRRLAKGNSVAGEQSDNPNATATMPSYYTSLDDLESLTLDIVVSLCQLSSPESAAKYARFGVWYLQHSDITTVESPIPGFWESIESHHKTGSALLANVAGDPGIHVLAQSWSSTDYFSPARNRNESYWKTLYFLPRKIEELQRTGCANINELGHEDVDLNQLRRAKRYSKPTNWDAFIAASGQVYKLAQKTIETVFKPEHWFLMFHIDVDSESKTGMPTVPKTLDLPNFHKIMPPRDRLWADPFVIERDDKYYLFIEDLPYKTWKGIISLIEIDKNGRWTDARKVLETDYHLSYPFLFEWQDALYMIPESHKNKTIELYKCTQFPDRWEFQMNLMEDIIAVDATLFQYGEKWWLFAGHAECDGMPPDDELFLFYADQPITTEWIPHPLNPIVSDIRFARPAGAIFEMDGKIIRPSQDSAKVYGHGLNFQEIEILSETDYRERTISQIKPTWDKTHHGIHTYIKQGNLTVVDVLTYRFKYWG